LAEYDHSLPPIETGDSGALRPPALMIGVLCGEVCCGKEGEG